MYSICVQRTILVSIMEAKSFNASQISKCTNYDGLKNYDRQSCMTLIINTNIRILLAQSLPNIKNNVDDTTRFIYLHKYNTNSTEVSSDID